MTREQLPEVKEQPPQAGAGAARLHSERNSGIEKRTVVPASAKLEPRRSALKTRHWDLSVPRNAAAGRIVFLTTGHGMYVGDPITSDVAYES